MTAPSGWLSDWAGSWLGSWLGAQDDAPGSIRGIASITIRASGSLIGADEQDYAGYVSAPKRRKRKVEEPVRVDTDDDVLMLLF